MAESPAQLQAEIEKYEQKHSENPEGRYFVPLANAHRKLGEFGVAERLLREGLRLHPDYLSAHIVLGRTLADEGSAAQAVAEFRHVLGIDPQNLVALRSLGELAVAAGDAQEAGHWFRELLAVDPMNEEARQSLLEIETPSGEQGEESEFQPGGGWWEAGDEGPTAPVDPDAGIRLDEDGETFAHEAGSAAPYSLDRLTSPVAPDSFEVETSEAGADTGRAFGLVDWQPEDGHTGETLETPEPGEGFDRDWSLPEPLQESGAAETGAPSGLDAFETPDELRFGDARVDDEDPPTDTAPAETEAESADATEWMADLSWAAGEAGVVEDLPALAPADAPRQDVAEPEPAGGDELGPDEILLSGFDDDAQLVTETMAELYAAQGFPGEAIGVYRELIRIRGEEPALVNRLAQLEQEAATRASGEQSYDDGAAGDERWAQLGDLTAGFADEEAAGSGASASDQLSELDGVERFDSEGEEFDLQIADYDGDADPIPAAELSGLTGELRAGWSLAGGDSFADSFVAGFDGHGADFEPATSRSDHTLPELGVIPGADASDFTIGEHGYGESMLPELAEPADAPYDDTAVASSATEQQAEVEQAEVEWRADVERRPEVEADTEAETHTEADIGAGVDTGVEVAVEHRAGEDARGAAAPAEEERQPTVGEYFAGLLAWRPARPPTEWNAEPRRSEPEVFASGGEDAAETPGPVQPVEPSPSGSGEAADDPEAAASAAPDGEPFTLDAPETLLGGDAGFPAAGASAEPSAEATDEDRAPAPSHAQDVEDDELFPWELSPMRMEPETDREAADIESPQADGPGWTPTRDERAPDDYDLALPETATSQFVPPAQPASGPTASEPPFTPQRPSPVTPPPASVADDEDDLESFQAWLRSLKR
jgi:tetratricopeptide (TPR) repeat protein